MIIFSLNSTIEELIKQKQTWKLSLYKKFYFILILYIIVSAMMILFQSLYAYFRLDGNFWYLEFSFDAFWSFSFYFVFLGIMFLWKPSQNNHQYAYSDQIAEVEDDDDENFLSENDDIDKSDNDNNDNKIGLKEEEQEEVELKDVEIQNVDDSKINDISNETF
jgi:hypothetical protein